MAGSEPTMSSPLHASETPPKAIPRGFHSESASPIGRHRASVDPTGAPYPLDTNTSGRRPSFADRIGSLSNAGGYNSFNKFAASWQRAAGFKEISSRNRSFSSQVGADDDDEGDESEDYVPDMERAGMPSRTSLLRSAFDNDRRLSEPALEDDDGLPESASRGASHRSRRSVPGEDNLFNGESQQSASFGGSYGSAYSHPSQRIRASSGSAGGHLASRRESLRASQADKEREPLLSSRPPAEDERRFSVVPGESTVPQTVFNSVNTLVGVGMLSLPLAILYSGWLIGLGFFLFSTVATSYTAKLLAKCLNVDASLLTFADIAYGAFGNRARIGVSLLFTVELLAANVALVILFSDSIVLLVPALNAAQWKVVCGAILIPLNLLPLRLLSFGSIVGIVCCIVIVIAIFVDGFIKPSAFGSLRDPAPTFLFPRDWKTIPLAFGLLMAPWGGHSVFPNIYRDMRHPEKYNKAVNITYIFTYVIEVALAIAGYLMFGETVRDEVTANIFITKGYPRWLSMLIVISITIVPITKIPLSARPIVTTVEVLCGVDARSFKLASRAPGGISKASLLRKNALWLTIRLLTPVVLVVIAILIPDFDRVLSLLGSAACFAICIILPCSFHLKIFGKELSLARRILDWVMLVTCFFLAIIGTVTAFLPKEMLGVKPKG